MIVHSREEYFKKEGFYRFKDNCTGEFINIFYVRTGIGGSTLESSLDSNANLVSADGHAVV